MERTNRKYILMIMLISILILTGCSKIHLNTFDAGKDEVGSVNSGSQDNNQDVKEDSNNKEEINASDESIINGITTEIATPTPSKIKPTANTELQIYTINEDTGDIEAATALVPEGTEITPELIVNNVIESLADKSINIGVEKVSTQGKAVIVSFYSDQPPLTEVGAGIEAGILDAIAQSLTDNNLKDYNQVIYRVEGKAYVSDHFDLGIDEVYLGDN